MLSSRIITLNLLALQYRTGPNSRQVNSVQDQHPTFSNNFLNRLRPTQNITERKFMIKTKS